ncbi:MAG TPA: PAS domain-containing protein [bacterium]
MVAAEAALVHIAAVLNGAGRPDHHGACARHLAEVLGVNMALVADFSDSGETRLLGAWSRDGRTPPAISVSRGTPWAELAVRGSLLQEQDVGARYPGDAGLTAVGAEGLAGRLLRDAAGQPAGIVAVLDTVPLEWTAPADAVLALFAAHAEAEIRARRSERLLSHVAAQWTETMDAMPEFIAVISPDYRLIRVNRALADLASSHPRDLIGRTCHSVLHGLDRPWPECPHEEALHAGRGVTRELFDPHLGLPLQVTCTPLFEAGGQPLGTVHVARDISEQKHESEVRDQLIRDLREALSKVRHLSGMLPICAWCKRIRNDQGYWDQVEDYIREHSEASFTHGICPECVKANRADFGR